MDCTFISGFKYFEICLDFERLFPNDKVSSGTNNYATYACFPEHSKNSFPSLILKYFDMLCENKGVTDLFPKAMG